jgi:hypothetical protein
MERNRSRLIVSSILYLVNAGVGATIALRENLPGEFAGKRSGKPARDDFVTGFGTALSPSLSMLVVQALFIVLMRHPGRLRTLGIGGLTINGVLFTIGMLGEPITYRIFTPRAFDLPKALVVAGNIGLPLSMLVFGASELAARRQLRHTVDHE